MQTDTIMIDEVRNHFELPPRLLARHSWTGPSGMARAPLTTGAEDVHHPVRHLAEPHQT